MRLIYRLLVEPKTFWGITRIGGGGWRIGFGVGFLEIGTSTSGIWILRRKDSKC